MIKSFGRDLAREADKDNPVELGTAYAMRTWSVLTLAAWEISRQATGSQLQEPTRQRAPARVDQTQQSDDEIDWDKESDDEDIPGADEASQIERFVSESHAYKVFRNTLLEFAHKPYEKRVSASLNDTVIGESAS